MAVNQNIIELEYAVRGPIPMRAAVLKKQGRTIIPCNIGNPQALGQRPMTYYRQVLSLLEDPGAIARGRKLNQLLAGKDDDDSMSDYILDLAESLLDRFEVGLGAYSESKGPLFIRQAISRYIDERDGAASTGAPRAEPEQIFLTNGASEGARRMLELLITDPRDGIMIPIPQYPLYSATIRRCGGVQVDYYPDEDAGWTLDVSTLEESLTTAERDGVKVKAIVVINPGNPTGAVMDLETIRALIDFAREHRILIIADEVYQENVYGAEFASFAKMLGDDRSVPLVSLHSISKGFYGECGHRGGYLEVRNPPAVVGTDNNLVDLLLKVASVNLCPNTVGQLLTYLMVTPPEAGTEPHTLFVEERARILDDLHQKATMIREAFEQMDSVECFGRTGAMYLFPRLNKLPAGATDFDYCSYLLETTGLTTVNGSGFGQKPGTHHLRVAFLPPKETLEEVLPNWITFHNAYVNR
ncbi:MAG: aminotransferase class I/II-fold pyridoxal phosphate-dependent enzyme [Deltaproteobacteria bacterium]|nr:aminotransferase class I/II-fold pyridoxal phosphate-dependent enzyme [Deltaproteobacteria bacterium]